MTQLSSWEPTDLGIGLGNTGVAATQRIDAVRLVLPGIDDQSHRLQQDDARLLSPILTTALEELSNVGSVELLTFNGPDQQEHILTPRLERSESDADAVQATLPTTESSSGGGPTLGNLADIVTTEIPEQIGVETCSVDLSTLGISPVATHRFILGENRAITNPNHLSGNVFLETVRRLAAHGYPHLTQTIISSQKQAYIVTFRVAVVHPEFSIGTCQEFVDHFDHGRYFPLPAMHDAGVTTNFDLPIEDFYEHRARDLIPTTAKYRQSSDTQTARQLYEGSSEFYDLIRGRHGCVGLYADLGYYARMPVTELELGHFAVFAPIYYPESLWGDVPARSDPNTNTIDVLRAAQGTDQSLGTGLTAVPTSTADRPVTDGKAGHIQLEEFIAQIYREWGHEVSKPDGDSVADLKAILNTALEAAEKDQQMVRGGEPGQEINVEAEHQNITKPAKTLRNYARASYQNVSVHFVTKDRGDAEAILKRLREPYNCRVDDGIVLYTGPELRFADGEKAVLTETIEGAVWVLTHEGQLQLRTDDEDERVLADVHPETRVTKSDVDARGIKIASGEYSTDTDEAAVQTPHIPVDIHCLQDATIMYKAGNVLETLDDRPTWATAYEKGMDRNEEAIEEFIDQYLAECDGASIDYSEFQTKFQEFVELFVAEDPPVPSRIGVAMPEDVDVDSPNVRNRQINDYTWRIRPGLLSPYFPFTDDDESAAENESAE